MAGEHIICDRTETCGFRVHGTYFAEKKHFSAGVCPRCGGPVRIVKPYTDDRIVGATIGTDRNNTSYGVIKLVKGGSEKVGTS